MGKSSCGETLFHEKLFEGKVLRQNFLRKLIGKTSAPKTSIAEKVPGRKVSRGKLFAQNFHGETFIQKNFHRKFQSPTKTIRDRRKGNRPGKDRVLEIHHLTQLYKGKARNDCGLYSGQGKLLQGKLIFRKLIFRKLIFRKLIFRKTSSARRQSPC